FEAQVAKAPDATAVMFEDASLSYRELNRRANQLAHFLRGLGTRPDARVGICLERGPEMIVALLAVLKAGRAYVPLDPSYPRERLSYMLEDAGVGVVLTRQELLKHLPEFWGRTVLMDLEWESIDEQSEDEPVSEVAAENLAYVIYTSGSTGKPKGVMVEHEG